MIFSCIMGSLLQALLWDMRTHSNMARMLSSYRFSLVVTRKKQNVASVPKTLGRIQNEQKNQSHPVVSPTSSSMGTASMGLSPSELIFSMDLEISLSFSPATNWA